MTNKKIKNKKLISGNIYFDTGKGFNADEAEIVSYYVKKKYFEIVLNLNSNVKKIRFCPVKEQCCILEKIQINIDNKLIDYSYTNGIKTENSLIFNTYAPYIEIDFDGMNNSMINISGKIYFVSSNDIVFFYKFTNNFKSLNTTTYLLVIISYIRRNKVLFLITEFILSVKINGIIKTLRKAISYTQKYIIKILYSIKYNSLLYECEYQKNIDFSEYTSKVKPIAFYLPQFHSIPENDEWWGKDFTEWTNTKKSKPRFKGHYQPREPHDDFGYYNLTDVEILKKQALLAKQHGIYGFCFYLYWFSGKRLLEKPMDLFLQHTEIDINFCFCWANENWTRRWDGQNNDILIKQNYSNDDPGKFIQDMKKYIVDKRYIRIDGIPIIMIYNPGDIPNIEYLLTKWREKAEEIGIGNIYILICNTNYHTAESLCIEDKIEGIVEFPPHNLPSSLLTNDINFIGKNEGLTALIYNYKELLSEIKKEIIIKNKNRKSNKTPIYNTCFLGWDNAARKKDIFCTFAGFSLKSFYEWASLLSAEALQNSFPIFFINAWNEWAEGTYLEPDKKYGYANINTLSKAIFGLPFFVGKPILKWKYKKINKIFLNKDDIRICVQVHLYDIDIIDEIILNLNYIPFPFNCYISTDTDEKLNIINNKFTQNCINVHKIYIKQFDNRGRDVAPFIEQMEKEIDKYEIILHIHSKKSRTNDGYRNNWREYLFKHLLGSTENIYHIFEKFIKNKNLGLVFPKPFPPIIYMLLWGGDNEQGKNNVQEFLKKIGIEMALGNKPKFASGNMFWARTKAIKKVFSAGINKNDFPIENNQIDMTLAHAIERSWVYVSRNEGYTFKHIMNKN
jgi:lipopolysaccharide biosynthesis protein